MAGFRNTTDDMWMPVRDPAENEERPANIVFREQLKKYVDVVRNSARQCRPLIASDHALEGVNLEILFDIHCEEVGRRHGLVVNSSLCVSCDAGHALCTMTATDRG